MKQSERLLNLILEDFPCVNGTSGDISDSKTEMEKVKSKAVMLYWFLAAETVLVGDRQLEVSYSSLKLFSLII